MVKTILYVHEVLNKISAIVLQGHPLTTIVLSRIDPSPLAAVLQSWDCTNRCMVSSKEVRSSARINI